MADRTRIALIEEHKVKSGETIKSLAEANGLTWQRLAKFNWGTPNPDEINKHLREDVGCTKKTPDGYNYVFTSEDDPGIVHIPKKWIRTNLALDDTYTIRVRRLERLSLLIRLHIDPTGASRDEDRFVLESTDGSYRSTKTVSDDQIPGDDWVDLRYSGLRRNMSYTLRVVLPGVPKADVVFEGVPYEELAQLSPSMPDDGDDEEIPPRLDDDADTEEPDGELGATDQANEEERF